MKLPSFSVENFRYGRIGKLHLTCSEISTPALFPVVSLMTGTTARGGGLWKYILQADVSNGLLRRELPVMSQVLHFLDFIRDRPHELEKWRKSGIKQRYTDEILPSLQFKSPLFLDSGGFKLLWNKSIDLSAYNLSMKNNKSHETILELQRDLNGDIVATLDYPLPPGLSPLEANERMQKSIINAVNAALYLQENPDYCPLLYVAAHGQDRDGISQYVKLVFKKFKEKKINVPFGLAIGSLVPLRGARKYSSIINIILGVKDSIPKENYSETPIHIFGVTGTIVPILAYLGIDSFDSSSYVQETRSLCYINPKTGRPQAVLEMEELSCNCRVCQNVNLRELQDALTSDIRGRPLPNGHYKSKYYGDIALHNLEMDFRLVTETREAIEEDSLPEYLIQHIEKFSYLRPALEAIAQEDDSLQVRLSRTVVSVPQKPEPNLSKKLISLAYTPDDFNILANGWKPLTEKHILLVIPCSGSKPYSESRSHRWIAERLKQTLGKYTALIDKVTLSGLYGPVPEEYERYPAIMNYDFHLETFNQIQIDLVSGRLVEYLERHSSLYLACLGYATSNAYRTVLEQVAQKVPCLQVLPAKPKTRRLTEFFRQENIEELLEKIKSNFDFNTGEV